MPIRDINVLVIDDDDDDLFLTCDCLRLIDTYTITIETERNYKSAREKILENKHHIYLVDYLLGPHTGVELIRDCVAAGINKPFILLTGKGDRQIDIDAARAGAYDYLTKSDLNAELLERSLRYSLQRYTSLKAIRESEDRYREIFIKSNDIIFVLDEGFNLVNFNPKMNSLLGYTKEELLHQPISRFFESEEDANAFFKHVMNDENKGDIEIGIVTKDGQSRTFLASCSRISSLDGIGKYQGILYDYTNIKKSVAEQLLREKIDTTERLVRTLAHEIRNPLTNINLSLHQLETEIDEDQKIFTDIVKRNSARINQLIGELMNLSNPVDKIERKINCTELVSSALGIAQDRMKLKGVKLTENYQAENATIIGDMEKLQTALLNIIINAIEAMEDGNGALHVETVAAEKAVQIKITDNGMGISSENIAHLFQPYFTGKKNGVGLGLATTHSYIHAHNGNIHVQSQPGKGTTFTVSLETA
ncbi:MAG TPA: ATP-binding protein [Chitinophagales bacterium]|nr:ATP-binding protein [Chitinophagales bacterium]